MKVVFWGSIAILLYTYFGYPLYIYMRSKIISNGVSRSADYKPFVSVIISAYNEGAAIGVKIANLLCSDYPADKIEVLVGSDGSRDDTNRILSSVKDKRVRAFLFQKRRGKASVIRDIAPQTKGEILVFCDARQIFKEDAISRLVSNFADKSVGCASGELVLTNGSDSNGIAQGIGLYWKYEKFIRRCESAVYSTVGATGAIYAIRKELYTAPPEDTILDDLYIPLAITRKGYRCVWDMKAKAYDKASLTPKEEYQRKIRTLAGNYQIFTMFADRFIPFKSGVAMPLFSHKLLRVLAPFFLISMFVSNVFLLKKDVYFLFLTGQILFYLLALIGSATYKNESKRFFAKAASTVHMFCLMNFTALAGFYAFLFGKQSVAWEK